PAPVMITAPGAKPILASSPTFANRRIAARIARAARTAALPEKKVWRGAGEVGAPPDVDRAREQRDPSVGFQAEPHRRWIGERGVAAAVPHAGDANAAPQRRRGGAVERSGGRARPAAARA